MTSLTNIDLLTVGIAIAANILIGFIVYISNRKSATNILFFLQTIILSLWSTVNYLSYQLQDLSLAFLLVRLVLFFAIPNSVIFLLLMNTFPSTELKLKKSTLLYLVVVSGCVMLLTLSKLVFSSIQLNILGAPTPTVGFGMIPFFIIAIVSILLGFYYIIKNFLSSVKGTAIREQFNLLLTGAAIMFFLIILTQFILPTVFHNSTMIPFAAFFTFPFIAFTAYAVYKHKLFDVRNIASSVLAFLLSIVAFTEIIFADPRLNPTLFIFRIGVFIVTLLICIQFIKNMFNLETANARQEGLINFIGHEVKGYLTHSDGAFAGIADGDYPAAPETQKFAKDALAETRKGVTAVEYILKASNLKKGTMEYHPEAFDMRALVLDSIEKLTPDAVAVGLTIEKNIPLSDNFTVFADKDLLGEYVIRNLIDNAIRYTPAGKITISLEKIAVVRSKTGKNSRIRFSVKDTGVGITPEDKSRLFTEGGHGKDSIKVNAHSTGYGLYIAKGVTEGSHGTIGASSDGPGKGSTFWVELNAA